MPTYRCIEFALCVLVTVGPLLVVRLRLGVKIQTVLFKGERTGTLLGAVVGYALGGIAGDL
jgi:hypothetical protein